jgi:hypothetical protein
MSLFLFEIIFADITYYNCFLCCVVIHVFKLAYWLLLSRHISFKYVVTMFADHFVTILMVAFRFVLIFVLVKLQLK